ncbi:hypothetical protein [Nocardia yamanashiensis]|uniref:hypothetical protein n=1 Tax=Nocardia yamanashiensis TaxID=209247 RepID=UPI00083348BF|nr:hypothetical protein [Nocardia yamanashiensis]
MGKYLPWLGSTILAVVALSIGVTPWVHAWPRWALIGFGALVLAAVLLTFPWPTASGPRRLLGGSKPVTMNQKAGNNSRMVQGGGNVRIEGGMGDQK